MSLRQDMMLASSELGFEFIYARKDFVNLLNGINAETPILIVDPIKTYPLRTATGVVSSYKYTGMFLLMLKSQMDEKYYEKVDNYIEPLEIQLERLAQFLFGCNDGYNIDWSYDEVINRFNINLDGLLVRYTITI